MARLLTRSRVSRAVQQLRLEALEDRATPAIFTLQNLPTISGLNNNGCVVAGDFNKDGKMDAVLTNFGTDHASGAGSTITIMQGNGAGGFSSGSLTTGGRNPSFAAVADLNGDTWPDLLVSNGNQQNTGSISIFMNDGSGNLALTGTPFAVGGNNSSWVGIADMTGDSVLDCVVASFGRESGGSVIGNNVTVFAGNGNGTFASNPTVTLAPEIQFVPTALALADFDGNGVMDIAATSPGIPSEEGGAYPNGSLYLFRGTGGGTFASHTLVETGGILPVNIQVAFLNSDTKPDLVIANGGNPNGTPEWNGNSVGYLMNSSSTGSINFGIPNALNTNVYGTFAVQAADFDLDGKTDIAAINYGSQFGSPAAFVSVYTGNGSGTFTPDNPGTYAPGAFYLGGQYLAVGDYDGNNTPDVLAVHASNRVTLLKNNSTPQTGTTTALSSSPNPSQSGQLVTLTATITPASGTITTGTVTFYDNGVQIGSPVNVTSQQAVLTTSSLSVGTHNLTARFSGGGGFSASDSNTVNHTVTAVNTPTVTINQGGGQADPTNSSTITYSVVFNQSVTGFDASDISFAGSTVGGTLVAEVLGSGATYTVNVTGMSGTGIVQASIPAGAAVNGTNDSSAASTSSDNTITFDGVAPTVTINQGGSQADPTTTPSVVFDVVFSESVTGFTNSDISFAGSTAGGTLSANVSGSGTTYTVTVTGITSGGLVRASIPGNSATDSVGNGNAASTSGDNTVTYQAPGSVGFKEAVYTVTEITGNLATITLARIGAVDAPISVTYNTADGTAHSGGPASTGQNDYTPTTNTISWAAGEGADKTFTIPILNDDLNEGRETIALTLTNPNGGAILATATLVVLPSDGQGPGKYFDSDGDQFTLKLAGKTGSLRFYRNDPDGNGLGSIELIELENTLPDPTKPKAALSVTVKKSKTTVDNGTVNIGAIVGSGLKAIKAKKANLTGDGIDIFGYLGGVTLGNIANGADISSRAGATPTQKTKIAAGFIGDGTTINVETPLTSFNALAFGDGAVTAPSIGKVNIKGYMEADITVTGIGLAPTANALGSLKVKGAVSDVDIMVNGHVGSVSVGSFRDSRLFVGYTGADDGSGSFTIPGIIGKFSAMSTDASFQNSRVIATAIRSATIRNLDDSNDEMFGFYADASIGTIRVIGPNPFVYVPNFPGDQGIGEFEAKIV